MIRAKNRETGVSLSKRIEGNIDHVKIAAENRSAAFSTPLDLGLLTMKKLIDDSLQTVQ